MKFREFAISDDAVEQGAAIGLPAPVKQTLVAMARVAAPVTHPAGNRRSGAYVLRIVDGVVEAVSTLQHGVAPKPKAKRLSRPELEAAMARFGLSIDGPWSEPLRAKQPTNGSEKLHSRSGEARGTLHIPACKNGVNSAN